MAKDPAERYQNAGDLHGAASSALARLQPAQRGAVPALTVADGATIDHGPPVATTADAVRRDATPSRPRSSMRPSVSPGLPVDRELGEPRGVGQIAAGGGLLVLVVAAVVVFALGGHSTKHAAAPPKHATKPAAPSLLLPPRLAQPPNTTAGTSIGTSTGTPPAAQTTTQLAALDSILNLAETGRQALADGDITTTIANRRTVLQELDALQPESELSASVQALKGGRKLFAARRHDVRTELFSQRRPGATRLKQAFLDIFNPIATRYNTPTYTAGEI